jgi:hypothetical protein
VIKERVDVCVSGDSRQSVAAGGFPSPQTAVPRS